jgi:restriction system protein
MPSTPRRRHVAMGCPPIELVDGEKLVEMSESVGLGLKQKISFELDPQFFEQFEA